MTVLLGLAAVAMVGAWGCAALSMAVHWQSATGRRSAPPARKLRWLSVALGLLALCLCVLRDGGAFGALIWFCLLSASAWMVVLALAWLRGREGVEPVRDVR